MTKNTVLALVCLLALTACESVQRDMTNSYNNSASALQQAFTNLKTYNPSDPASPQATVATNDNHSIIPATSGPAISTTTGPNCPSVRIVSDLNQVHQFTDGTIAARQNEVSSVQMQAVDTKCKVAKNSLVIDMNIAFAGEVGPKGRSKSGDKPSFAYPYFVAITNNQGSIVGKEVFALTLNYSGNSSSENRTEQVRQTIPLRDKDYHNYKIMIGFQIGDQELAYNRSLPAEYMSPSDPLGTIEPASGNTARTIVSPSGND